MWRGRQFSEEGKERIDKCWAQDGTECKETSSRWTKEEIKQEGYMQEEMSEDDVIMCRPARSSTLMTDLTKCVSACLALSTISPTDLQRVLKNALVCGWIRLER